MKGDIILYQNQTKTYMVIGVERWLFLSYIFGIPLCRNCHGLIIPGDFCYTSRAARNRYHKIYCGFCACRLGMF